MKYTWNVIQLNQPDYKKELLLSLEIRCMQLLLNATISNEKTRWLENSGHIKGCKDIKICLIERV